MWQYTCITSSCIQYGHGVMLYCWHLSFAYNQVDFTYYIWICFLIHLVSEWVSENVCVCVCMCMCNVCESERVCKCVYVCTYTCTCVCVCVCVHVCVYVYVCVYVCVSYPVRLLGVHWPISVVVHQFVDAVNRLETQHHVLILTQQLVYHTQIYEERRILLNIYIQRHSLLLTDLCRETQSIIHRSMQRDTYC